MEEGYLQKNDLGMQSLWQHNGSFRLKPRIRPSYSYFLILQFSGFIASSQNLAYMISKFIGGILADSMDPKLMFSGGLLVAGIFTMSFPSKIDWELNVDVLCISTCTSSW